MLPVLRLLSVRRLHVFTVHVPIRSINAPTIYDCYESLRVPTSCPPFEYTVLRATKLYNNVLTATWDSDGEIIGSIDALVSILRSKERDSAIELITHRDVRPQRRDVVYLRSISHVCVATYPRQVRSIDQ